MKVICINAGSIKKAWGVGNGGGLVEGRIYTAVDEAIDEEGEDCYIIEELLHRSFGLRLKCRFRIIDTDWIDEAIEKALNEEPELVNA